MTSLREKAGMPPVPALKAEQIARFCHGDGTNKLHSLTTGK